MSLNGAMSVIEAGSSAVPSRLRYVMSIERRALKACAVIDSPLAGLASVGDRARLAVGADDHELLDLGRSSGPPVLELSEKRAAEEADRARGRCGGIDAGERVAVRVRLAGDGDGVPLTVIATPLTSARTRRAGVDDRARPDAGAAAVVEDDVDRAGAEERGRDLLARAHDVGGRRQDERGRAGGVGPGVSPSPWPIAMKPVTWKVVRRRPVAGADREGRVAADAEQRLAA